MLLTVFCAPRDSSETTFALDVSPDLELRDFVALCELESGIPAGEIQIIYAEQPLQDPTRSLGTYGLKDGDVLVLRQAERRPPAQPPLPGLPRIDFSSIAVPGTSGSRPARRTQQPAQPRANTPQQRPAAPAAPAGPAAPAASSPQGLDDPSLLREMLLANPHELSLLKERNPPLAEALLSGDLARFTKVLQEQQQDRARREQERIRLLTADPFDLDAQAKIEEDIRQHNIEENMNIAMEEAPESFGQVVMLYINCKVNGHPVKAFVDSGAQMTIMSQACAERCNIMRLVDRRWAGIAKGVGTQKIIGRVHLAQVQIEGDFLPCSFSILEDQPMDMLLGLDMLKRHQCSIDLKKSVLLIGTTGSETRFLPEGELPECARLAYGPEGRDEPRPEEIADRELAEAIQRSVQESVDTEDGQTTSSRSAPKLFYEPFDKAPSPTPSTSGAQGRVLDRSQSAPTPLPPIHAPEPNSTNLDSPVTPSSAEGSAAPLPPVLEKPPHPVPAPSPSPSLQESPCSSVPSCSQPVPPPVPSEPLEMEESVPSAHQERHSPALSSLPDSHPPHDPCLKTTDTPSPSCRPSQEPWLSSVSRQEPASAPVDDMDSQPDVDNLERSSLAACEPRESCGSGEAHTFPPHEPLPQEKGSSKTCAPKRTCSPPPEEGRNAGGKRSPLPVPSDTNASNDPPVMVQPPCAPSKQATSEESMGGPDGDDDLERDQPEGGSCSSNSSSSGSSSNSNGSNNIPSLAQALKELHQLLVSNRALSPPADCRLDADGLDQQTPSTARSQPPVQGTSSADETLPPCPSEMRPGHSADSQAPPAEPLEPLERGAAMGCQPDTPPPVHMADSDERAGWSEAGETLPPVEEEEEEGEGEEEDMTEREPPEGQQGRGEADGRDSGDIPRAPDAPDAPQPPSGLPEQQRPLSLAVGSSSEQPEGSCPHSSANTLPSTPLSTRPAEAPVPSFSSSSSSASAAPPAAERFPAADIQRIQAAGFSAQEAAEALEQARGCVELALLALLARKISVPT